MGYNKFIYFIIGALIIPQLVIAQTTGQFIPFLRSTQSTSTNATSTNLDVSASLRFDGEILPDGSLCSNGEILKKTGAGDWDCATDATGGAGGGAGADEFTYTQVTRWNPYLTPTSTAVGLLTVGSSTFARLNSEFSTSTQATSTYLAVTGTTALGDNAADVLTITATSTFAGGGVTFSTGGVSIIGSGGLTVSGTTNINTIITDAGSGAGAGTDFSLTAGIGGATGNGGAILLTGGSAGGGNGDGGSITLQAGDSSGIGTKGIITLTDGSAVNSLTVNNLTVSSLAPFLVTGSSTLQNYTFINATGTNATTTGYFSTLYSSSTYATTSELYITSVKDCNGTSVLETDAAGNVRCGADGGGDVSSVSNADGTLTISPTTGSVVASLNLSNLNTWPVLQTFDNFNATDATTTRLTVTSSSTFYGFVNLGNSTTTGNATTTNFVATSSASTTNLYVSSDVGIGTTTPQWPLQIASSTRSQLTLSSGSLTDHHWSFRSVGGQLYIATSSAATFATATPAAITIDGNIGSSGLFVGTSTPGATGLAVNGTSFLHGLTQATGGANNALCMSAVPNEVIEETTGVCVVSFRASKDNIKTLTVSALDMVSRMNPVSFNPKSNDVADYEDLQFGLIAEELAAINPHLVKYGLDGKPRTIDQFALNSILISAIQELDDKKQSNSYWGLLGLLGLLGLIKRKRV